MLREDIVIEINRIFEEELPQALELHWEKHRGGMTQSIAANVLQNVRHEVRRDHAETRTRLQILDKAADEAAKNAALAVDKSDILLDSVRRLEALTLSLLSEVRENAGRLKAKTELKVEQDQRRHRFVETVKWIGTVGAGGAIYKLWHYLIGR